MIVDELRSMVKGSKLCITGYNGALATSNEHVAGNSVAYGEGDTNCNAIFTTTRNLEVASTNAADAAAGTGLRTLLVMGADTDGAFQEETITMNGTTSVVGTKGFKTIYAAIGLTYGTGLANAGIIGIALRKAAGCTNTSGALTAPTPAITIAAGANYDTQTLFVCPPGRRFVCENLEIAATTQPVVCSIYVRAAELGTWFLLQVIPVGNMGVWNFKLGFILAPGDAVRVDALSTTAAGRVGVVMKLSEVYGRD